MPLFIDSVSYSWETCIEEDVLSERAWVLQERLLSCRTLFSVGNRCYGSARLSGYRNIDILTFSRRSERYCPPNQLTTRYRNLERWNGGTVERVLLQALEHDERRDYTAWHHMLSTYSTKTLTVPSDKRPALAGIAHAFKSKNDINIAGNWLIDWLGGLLWHAVAPKTLNLPLGMQRSRAPSWSWASLDAPIHFTWRVPTISHARSLGSSVWNWRRVSCSILSNHLSQHHMLRLEH